MNIFKNYPDHPTHFWFGDGAVQDIRPLNGCFRATLLGPLMRNPMHEGIRDFATFDEAAAELIAMHDRFFKVLVWC